MRTLFLAPLLALALPAAAQQAPAPAAPAYGPSIALADAQKLVDRALAESRKRGFRMAVAVVDISGELVAFVRMDDTQFGSIRIAQQKARTATRMRSSTADIEKRVLAGRIVTLAADEVLPIAGGVPILADGRIVGAIGVSGGSAAQDDEIAQAALAAAR